MRIFIIISLIALAALFGGVYGAFYDQLTYSVSSEFFTKMRFAQYGIEGNVNERWEVAKIGFANTWSVGLVLGVILSLSSLLHTTTKKMFYTTFQAFVITIVTALIFSLIAYLFAGPSPEAGSEINVVDKDSFNKVLSMNNYSYNGGIIGMFLGLGWQIFRVRRLQKK